MKKITLMLLLFATCFSFAQTTLISPAAEGGFEVGATFSENGWTAVGPDTNMNRRWYCGTGQSGYTGERCAFIGNNETTVGTATGAKKVHLYKTITIPEGAEDIILNFDYKQATSDYAGTTYYDYIAVYTSPNAPVNNALPTGSGGTLRFGPYPDVDLPDFTGQTVTLPNSLAGTTFNLIFTFVCDNVSPVGYGALDNVSLTYALPSCAAPSALSYSNLTDSSATVTWNPSVSNPSGGYQYYFSTDATAPDAASVPNGNTASTTANITGLATGTANYFWVRSDCGSGSNSSWAGPLTLATPCEAATLPYAMGFEQTDGLGCLKIQNVNGNTTWTINSAGGDAAASGTSSARYKYNATHNADDWFFLQGLSLSAGETYLLTFKYKASGGPTFVENLEVKYGTGATADSMTDNVVTYESIDTTITDAFLESQTTITPAASGTYYFGFHCYSAADQAFLYVDDISVQNVLGVPANATAAVKIYPNPAGDVLNISSVHSITAASVYNLLGQKVLERNSNDLQVQLSTAQLATGTYLLRVTAGSTTETVKFNKK